MQTPPLVGRELDLAVGLEQLKRVEAGTPAALLVRGEAGVGKSRLVAELADRAAQLGNAVIAGRADELDHGIPYAILRDLLARLAMAGDEHRELIDRQREALDAGTDEGELGTVFAGTVQLFRVVAAGRAVVVVLEDLHAADRSSLGLAALLARLGDLGMLLVVTLRPGTDRAADLERLLEQMEFDGRAAIVDLEPLDRHDTQAVITAAAGAPPDDALAAAVFAASGGNPFFAMEAVRSFADGGAIRVDGGRARLVPDAPVTGLRPSTALLRRLFVGTSADTELAKVIAVFARFSLRHLSLVERLTRQPEHEVASSFDRLVSGGLLCHDESGGYAFTHSIVRDTLYKDIGPAERRRIHAAIAAEMAKDRRSGIVLDIVELATHVSASAEPGDEAAAEVLIEAGRAIAATAPLVSAEHLRRAAELLPSGSGRRGDALAMQARALHLGSRPREAAEIGRAALAELTPGPARSATAAIVVNDLYSEGRVNDALDVVERVLADGADRCPLLALQVNLLMEADRPDEAARLFDSALEALDAPDVPASAALMAYAHLVQYANHVGRIDVATDLHDRIIDLTTASSPTVALAAHELAAFADWRPGMLARVDRHLEAARRLRPNDLALSIGGSFEIGQVRSQWMRGDWDNALEVIRRASFELEQRGAVDGSQLLLAMAVDIHVDRGNVDQASTLVAQLATPILALRRTAVFVRARLHHALGRTDEAVALLEGEISRVTEHAGVWRLSDMWRELVDLHVEAGREQSARAGVEALAGLAARTGWLECELPALRARAVVFHDVGAARAYAELAEAEGWEVERAHAALVLGELDEDATFHLNMAYKLFDSFGAAPWRRRAAAGLRARGLTVPRRAAQPRSELTETEVQLVRLVRDGLSNRQIATAMHYSPKTIEVYLSRVYAKTACASRLELIRAVDTGAVNVDD